MSRPTEESLRRPGGVHGIKIRMGDGQVWTFPVRPLFGDIAKELLGKLEAVYDAQRPVVEEYRRLMAEAAKEADPESPGDVKGPGVGEEVEIDGADELVDTYHAAVGALTFAALRVNYPDIAEEHAFSLLTTQHTVPVVEAISGKRELEDIFPRRSDP